MKSISRMTQAELATYVQAHLLIKGITVILSGGAAVSIYTDNQYVSADIDLVDVNFAKRNKISAAMEEIGFKEKNRYFIHPDTTHIVEFPPGPLSVGDEPVRSIKEIKFSTGILRVISPTDCVKDRLAAYYYWKDQQSLLQALLVAKHNRVGLTEIRRWSEVTGNMKEFRVFLKKRSSKSK
jgi:hypothetical protein